MSIKRKKGKTGDKQPEQAGRSNSPESNSYSESERGFKQPKVSELEGALLTSRMNELENDKRMLELLESDSFCDEFIIQDPHGRHYLSYGLIDELMSEVGYNNPTQESLNLKDIFSKIIDEYTRGQNKKLEKYTSILTGNTIDTYNNFNAQNTQGTQDNPNTNDPNNKLTNNKPMEYVPSIEYAIEHISNMNISKENKRILGAYLFAKIIHAGQPRQDDKPYIVHPLAVALEIAKRNFDSNVIIAALLHDVVEDGNVTLDTIKEKFGSNVADIVSYVTKPKLKKKSIVLGLLTQYEWVFPDNPEYYIIKDESKGLETTREKKKIYAKKTRIYFERLSNSGNINSIIVKIFDSLSNLRDIQNLPKWKVQRNVQTMINYVFSYAKGILDAEDFNQIVQTLEQNGFSFPTTRKKHVSVMLFPEREAVVKRLDKLPPHDNYDISIYIGNNLKNNFVELGFPIELEAWIKKEKLFSVLKDNFSDLARCEISEEESMLPSTMGAHELIVRVTFEDKVPAESKIMDVVKKDIFYRLFGEPR